MRVFFKHPVGSQVPDFLHVCCHRQVTEKPCGIVKFWWANEKIDMLTLANAMHSIWPTRCEVVNLPYDKAVSMTQAFAAGAYNG